MRRTLLRGIAVVLLPALLAGQFVSVVSDPIQEAHSWTQIADDITMINQAIRIYNQIAYAAGWTPVRTPWLGVATPTMLSNTPGGFGETGAWNEAVNLGMNIPMIYSQATYAMRAPGYYSKLALGQSILSATMASVHIADGANPAAMIAIASSRQNQARNDLALSALEQSAQDIKPGENSQVEQLNQLSSSTVLTNRQLENTNALLTSLTEQTLLSNKMQRDSLADAVNFEADYDNMLGAQATVPGGSAQTIMSW